MNGLRRHKAAKVAALWILCAGCPSRTTQQSSSHSRVEGRASQVSARTDVVDAVGAPDSLDIATWNIQNFPSQSSTPQFVADLIASMALDFVAVQEIGDVQAFDALMKRLPGFKSVLSSHRYRDGSFQKLGVIYRASLLDVHSPTLLFRRDYDFPRPPLLVSVRTDRGISPRVDFLAINVHLKAGQRSRDFGRRKRAAEKLERYMRRQVDGPGEDDIVLLGDINQTLAEFDGQVLAPFVERSRRYTVRTRRLFRARRKSHLYTRRLIDHIITTSSFREEIQDGETVIPKLNEDVANYLERVSDHLPVVIRIPLR